MPILIRDARPEDRDAIVAIVPRLRAFGEVALYSPQQLDAGERETLERVLETRPEGDKLVVAELDGLGVVGLAYGHPESDYFTHETYGHLGIIAVAEVGEGKGVGRALLDAIEAWSVASGHRFLTLNVFDANTRAQSFYERAGYARDTIRYYKKRD
ncbi:MAG: family N-acetyltransferase [Gemmatimonadetes bacterium]|nr:family N-acetyltransferase [Gemmatimonadota bacterium]